MRLILRVLRVAYTRLDQYTPDMEFGKRIENKKKKKRKGGSKK